MRYTIGILLLLSSASLLSAVTIHSGTFMTYTNLNHPIPTFPVFSGPNLSVSLLQFLSEPLCLGGGSSVCNVSFTRTYNLLFDTRPIPNEATVVYEGNTYKVDLLSAPNTSLILNLSFFGPTVPVTLTQSFPGSSIFGSVSNVPFTMMGSATLTVNGIVIFSNLALSGSGLAAYSSANHPQQFEGTAGMTFVFAQADVPEPAAYTTAALGLAGLTVLRRRQQQKEQRRPSYSQS